MVVHEDQYIPSEPGLAGIFGYDPDYMYVGPENYYGVTFTGPALEQLVSPNYVPTGYDQSQPQAVFATPAGRTNPIAQGEKYKQNVAAMSAWSDLLKRTIESVSPEAAEYHPKIVMSNKLPMEGASAYYTPKTHQVTLPVWEDPFASGGYYYPRRDEYESSVTNVDFQNGNPVLIKSLLTSPSTNLSGRVYYFPLSHELGHAYDVAKLPENLPVGVPVDEPISLQPVKGVWPNVMANYASLGAPKVYKDTADPHEWFADYFGQALNQELIQNSDKLAEQYKAQNKPMPYVEKPMPRYGVITPEYSVGYPAGMKYGYEIDKSVQAKAAEIGRDIENRYTKEAIRTIGADGISPDTYESIISDARKSAEAAMKPYLRGPSEALYKEYEAATDLKPESRSTDGRYKLFRNQYKIGLQDALAIKEAERLQDYLNTYFRGFKPNLELLPERYNKSNR